METLYSFDKSDGAKRLIDLHQLMKPRIIEGQEWYVVFPAEDDKVLRVVRKIVRGLCYYHQVLYRNSISDDQVWVDILKYKFPQEYWEMLEYHHREPDIAEYRYKVLNEDDIHSVWVISFYNSVDFIGIVSQTP